MNQGQYVYYIISPDPTDQGKFEFEFCGLFRVSEFGLRIFAIGKIAVIYSGAEILWTKTVAEGSGF